MIPDYYKRILTVISVLLTYLSLGAQIPMTLYYMENLPQTSLVNPAMSPRCNGYFGIPVISNFTTYYQGDIYPDVFLQKGSNGLWLSPLNEDFNYKPLYKAIGKTANINVSQRFAPFYMGFRAGKGYFSFSFSQVASMQTGLPADLFKFSEVGMPDGTSYNFKSLRIKTMYYSEFLIGYSREINEHLTVGMNLKPLFGKGAFVADFNKFIMKAGRQTYDVSALGHVHTSLPAEIYSEQGEFADSIVFEELDAKEVIDKYVRSFKNPGIAIDLGGVYSLNKRWSFSLAVNNLGFISWKEDLNSIKISGDYQFDGVNLNVDNYDNEDDIIEEITDSLKQALDYHYGKQSFRTPLIPVFFAGSSYTLNHAVSLGFLSRSMFEKYNFRQDFYVSANFNLYHFITANFNYNITLNGGNYAGFGLAGFIGPLQIYTIVDHIPASFKYVKDGSSKYPVPDKLKSISYMFGVNLIFGSKGYRNKPMVSVSK